VEGDGGVIMLSENLVPKAARLLSIQKISKHNRHILLLSALELTGHVLSKTIEIYTHVAAHKIVAIGSQTV
jgi:hypothetical protein